MTENQIQDGGTYVIDDRGHGKLPLTLQPHKSFEFSVKDATGQQKYFIIDLIHCNPNEEGVGRTEINWEVNLQWWEGAWQKVVTITNSSRSEQKIEVLIQDLPFE